MRGNGQSEFNDGRRQAPAGAPGESSTAPAESTTGPAFAAEAGAERTATREGVAFAISERSLPSATSLVTVEGELDLASAPGLKRALTDVLAGGTRRIVVDLEPVTFIDSTALGVLVGVHRKLDTGVRLALAGAGSEVLNIFELTGLDATFDMFSTLDEALVWVRRNEAPTG